MENEMKKTLVALAAVLATSGIAMANDYTGGLQYETPKASHQLHNDRYGDAAPRSVVVKAPSVPNYSGSAALSRSHSSNGPTPTNQFDR
jgi:hypothetical protein